MDLFVVLLFVGFISSAALLIAGLTMEDGETSKRLIGTGAMIGFLTFALLMLIMNFHGE